MTMQEYMTLDIECFPNYFLVLFRNHEGRYREFELYAGHPLDTKKIRGLMMSYPTITFNGLNYDLPMLSLALAGADNEDLKEASDRLVTTIKPWQFYKSYKVSELSYDHIDIYEPSPGVMVSLKLYGGRMHMPKLRDLPYDPDSLLNRSMMDEVLEYCKNDHETTHELYRKIKPRIDLRVAMGNEYRVDLRSKSDAQIAEAVIKAELQRLTGKRIGKQNVKEREFFYQVPDYISFQTPRLQEVLEIVKRSPFLAKTNGQIEFTKELADVIVEMGMSKYKMGIGGLHSQEEERFFEEDDEYLIVDRDFASYYPSIILNLGLYPEALGTEFLDVYRTIVERRLDAKHTGNKVVAESLKITINGTFGKLGSVYSAIYAPDLMIQVTITGQLTLLMLIELLELSGISVVSANTDGIVIRCPRSKKDVMDLIISDFEKLTRYVTEETCYRGIYSRDVNNYIAITTDGKVKTKGTFSPSSLQKNPTNDICQEALIEYLKNGTPIEQTIRNCDDIRKFVSVRTVKGGGLFDGEYLGRVVRWYRKKGETRTINYRASGNKVPKSDGACPVMELPETLPNDIDYDYYIAEANELLMDIGKVVRPPKLRKARAKKVSEE